MITKIGESFSARVASSLLNSLDLNELVTKSEREYHDLILKLSLNRTELNKIKKKLHKNLSIKPLFNSNLYIKNYEKALQDIYKKI